MKEHPFIPVVLSAIMGLAALASAAEIHEAVKAGNPAAVRAIVDKDPAQLNARDETGRMPLHWAARGTNNEVLAYLVEKGADLNALDNNGIAPLHSLASRGNAEGIKILLNKGADLEIKSPNKSTPLHFAALGRQVEAIRRLVELRAKIESRDDYGRTPLVAAAREMAGPAVVGALLDLGANIDSVDRFEDTALSLAAWRGSAEVVDLLLKRNASVPISGDKGRQLLGFAVSKGLAGLFSRMVEKGADLGFESGNGRTLLHDAAAGGSGLILETLTGKGLDVNRKEANGWTPLHYAVDMGRTAAVELLLAKGADIQARTLMGQSAYNLAEDCGDRDMMAFLAARGFDRGPARFPELTGEYLGQKKPGRTAEMFAPGIVSGRHARHSNIVFSPDGKEAFWGLMFPRPVPGYGTGRMLVSRLEGGRWTYPKEAVFDGTKLADVPVFHPDGTILYDMSRRPFPGGRDMGKENIWMWDKGPGGWTNPRPLDPAVNDLPQHWQFGVDREKSVYFSTSVPGSLGEEDIYVSRLVDGRYGKPENLGPTVNTPAAENHPYVAPDGHYLLFVRNLDDIYVSFREKDGRWGEAKPLGPEVNTPRMELLPVVSPDGKYLFFAREGIFWVDASVIEDLRPKDTK
jgi:ankyrin repeat protein